MELPASLLLMTLLHLKALSCADKLSNEEYLCLSKEQMHNIIFSMMIMGYSLRTREVRCEMEETMMLPASL